MKVKGCVAVITGAATGMGRALTIMLAERGCHVACCDVDMDQLALTVEKATAGCSSTTRVSMHRVDVTDNDACKQFRDDVIREHGAVHILFNNAGISASGRQVYDDNVSPEEIETYEKGWDRCFNVCFHGVVYMTRAFLPVIIKQTEGYILNISSINAFWTWPEHTAYTAAKHAVKGYTDSLRAECYLSCPHVHVASVHPGWVKTDIAKKSIRPPTKDAEEAEKIEEQIGAFKSMARFTAFDAADWMLRGIDSNDHRILVGYDAWTVDLMARVAPRYMDRVFRSLGECGFNAHQAPGEPEKIMSIGEGLYVFANGGWYILLMNLPVPLLQITDIGRNTVPKLALAGAATALAAQQLMSRL